jgi:hypothetical protein
MRFEPMRMTHRVATVGILCGLGFSLAACRQAVRVIDRPAELVSCVQAALGNPHVLASVNAFELSIDAEPAPGNRTGRPDHTALVLDASGSFRRSSTMSYPGQGLKTSTMQFVDGHVVVTMSDDAGTRELAVDSEEQTIASLRTQLARWMFILFWRETQAVPLQMVLDGDSASASIGLDIAGPDGFNLHLTVDKATCRPIDATYTRPFGFGDGMGMPDAGASIMRPDGTVVQRYELADYVTNEGVSVPGTIRLSVGGTPMFIWHLKLVSLGTSRDRTNVRRATTRVTQPCRDVHEHGLRCQLQSADSSR